MRGIPVLAMLITAASALAQTTWTVDDDGGADFTEIQPAIEVAVDGDTVLVMPGTYAGIDLIGKALHVRSDGGPEITIISGREDDLALVCDSGEGPGTIVEGFSLTHVGEQYPSEVVLFEDASVTLRRCVVRDVNRDLHFIAPLRVIGGAPTLEECEFRFNQGDWGAIYASRADLLVVECLFSGNRSDNSRGGIVAVSEGSARFESSRFENNASQYGPAVLHSNAPITMIRCEFDGNAGGIGSDSGGILVYGAMTMTECVVRNNSSPESDGFVGAGLLVLRDCLFEDNTADDYGGAIAGGRVDARDCVFRRNAVGAGGGAAAGLYAGSVFEACLFEANSAFRGGAVHDAALFRGCEFTGNSADTAPVIFAGENELLLDRTRICDNGPTPIVGSWTDLGGNCVQEFCARCDCPADWDMGGTVNTADFIAYLDDWANGNGDADITADGIVDTRDFVRFLGEWSAGC